MKPGAASLELARRLTALPEPEMREQVLLEYLQRTDPASAVQVLANFQALGTHGGPPFTLALLALAGVLGRELLPYDLRAGLYAAAKEAGLSALLDLFFSSRGSEAARLDGRGPVDRELTLGHRKALARSRDHETLQKLLRDPEPEVVPILLRNPRLTERDVVLLAARRPTTPELQWCVFASRRWIARYAVKRALVLNPYTPTDLSLRLLSLLTAQDVRLVCESPSLPAPLREAASRAAVPA